MMKQAYQIYPIGIVRNKDNGDAAIEIDPAYADALLGLDGFSHLIVCYWFHENDTPEKRKTLRVHPRKNEKNPLTGVFGTRSPLRPNLIGLTCCRNMGVEKHTIFLDRIDAFDGSPVIDIKPCMPTGGLDLSGVRVPDWV